MQKMTKAELVAVIKRARGKLKRTPGDLSFVEWRAACKQEEKEFEERKLRRMRGLNLAHSR